MMILASLQTAAVVLVGLLSLASATPTRRQNGMAFVLMGDSTTNNGTTENSGGWSNGFCNSLSAVPWSRCANRARNGATTGSAFSSGDYAAALNVIKGYVGQGFTTYATVQYGHNDQKIADAASMGKNLTIMVDGIRGAGGIPILVTPLTRRSFSSNGSISDTLGPWATETKRIASVKGTLVIDLLAKSIGYCQKIGPDPCHRLNRTPTDNTHLNTNGTTLFGRMVALLIKAVLPSLALISNPTLDNAINNGIAVY